MYSLFISYTCLSLPFQFLALTAYKSSHHLSYIFYSYQPDPHIVILSTPHCSFSSCQLDLEKWQLICSQKAKIRVSRQPAEGCPNTRKCFTLRLFTLFTSVLLTAILLTPHEILRLLVNISTNAKNP